MTPWTDLAGHEPGILLIADHASAAVPEGIDLGVPAAVMREHVAIDIGVAEVAAQLGFAGVLGGVSRLVIDLNRDPEAAALVPAVSDDHAIPGNVGADVARRIADYWRPYHDHVAQVIAENPPKLLVSLHSFTPALRGRPGEARPWEVGVLYNRDGRAARIALPMLMAGGIIAGDNRPYSGRVLNATMNRHGEARGLPYLGLEVRQDLIGDAAGAAAWAARLRPIILATRDALA